MLIPVSVIVPCHNEATRLKSIFSLIEANAELGWEWVFVDDGSTDDTAVRIESFLRSDADRIRLISYEPNTGKGRAVREGLRQARGRLVGYVDADLAASPLDFAGFMDDPELLAGNELVAGIRVKGADTTVRRDTRRHVMGRVFRAYVQFVTRLNLHDTQCGFKLMAAETAHALAERLACNGFAFDVELLLLARVMGVRIREEPIDWAEQGRSTIRLAHILHMVIDLFLIRRRVRRLQNSFRCSVG